MNHYHVITHTDQARRDDEIYCVDDRRMAAETLTREVLETALWLGDGCDEGGCNHCGWCRTSRAAIQQASPVDTMAASIATAITGGYGVLILAPNDRVLSLQMTQITTPRGECEHHS